MLIIRVLRQNTPQTFCIVLKWTLPAGWTDRRSGQKETFFTVRFIDSAGQIHLEETGIALIPGVDEYKIVK